MIGILIDKHRTTDNHYLRNINRLFLLLLFLFSCTAVLAQTKTYEIGLSYETMKLSSLPIRVVEVLDARDSTSNIGWVYKGIKKKERMPATFEKKLGRRI